MTADDINSFLDHLNKSVDEYNNSYHRFIRRNHIHADFSVLPEKFLSSHKFP